MMSNLLCGAQLAYCMGSGGMPPLEKFVKYVGALRLNFRGIL